MERKPFIAPETQDNPRGWGPCSIAEAYKDMPYQPFSKSDRLGKIADWTNQTYADKRMASKYNSQFGVGAQYAYIQEDDESSFQLVDAGRGTTKVQRGKLKIGQRVRSRGGKSGPGGMQVLSKNLRGSGRAVGGQTRGGKWPAKNVGMKGRYDQKGAAAMKKREASVAIKSTWKIIEEMDFPRLGKLSLPSVVEPKDIKKCGAMDFYDKLYDRVTCKNEKRLIRVNRVFHKVTTTDDPIIRQLSKTEGNIYATDAIIATLMCSTRSVISWDLLVQKVGDKLFFDKRDDSESDLLTVNETAADPPYYDEDTKNSINWPKNLALEATFINHNFSQQVLKQGEERFEFPEKNPFVSEDEIEQVASVGYRYRKFDLGDDIQLICRCEHDAVTHGSGKDEIQFMNIKALNEWDSRHSGGIDWRQKLDVQRGAVLANELKNNSCKLGKWTVQALLAGSDYIKFGYVSRVHSRDSTKHSILGTQQFKPKEFADQINLNMDNAWGVLRYIIDTCMKLPEGKYLLLKDPNKPALLLYDIPNDTFETDDGESGSDDDDDNDN
ncbi:eukaryotic translation initiation factor 3 subunit D-like [Panonychus citri]|uniref:eukaryotic translation initiation factor 3 subunit D-like n=1 Tax=Panonychus citri TaxID=50023 RepID=UPI0023077F4C|nr:eukaryotic translation initiation factor 3 subunit D-like [Panonychus citri]